MIDYEHMALQIDLVVANILADIIGTANDAVCEVPSKIQSGSEAATTDNMPCPRYPSQSTENSEPKNLTEERNMESSLAKQLTKKKTKLRAQIHWMAIELEMTLVENKSLKRKG